MASKCGLTPQYTALEQLHEQFASRGLAVVGFPCKPVRRAGTGHGRRNCRVLLGYLRGQLPDVEKIDVNGPGRNAIYTELTAVPDADGDAGDVQWNFEKFLVRPDGTVAARFRPRTTPDDPEVIAAIEENLPGDYYLG